MCMRGWSSLLALLGRGRRGGGGTWLGLVRGIAWLESERAGVAGYLLKGQVSGAGCEELLRESGNVKFVVNWG